MQGMSGNKLSNPLVESKTRIYHGRVAGGSGRGARRGGGAGPGRAGRRQNSTPRRQASLVPPKASKKRCLNFSPEARTSETPCKPNAGTKSAVDDRFIRGLSPGREALFVPGCRPVYRRLFVFVNPFHARHVREKPGHTTGGSGRGVRRVGGAGSGRTGCQQKCSPTRHASRVPSRASKTNRLKDPPEAPTSETLCKPTGRVQNPDIPRAGRVGAHGGVAGRGRAGPDANRTVRPGDKRPPHPPKNRRHVA